MCGMGTPRTISTVAEVIDALGGQDNHADNVRAVARWAAKCRGTVYTWQQNEWIPGWYYKAMTDDLAERGYVAPARLWRNKGFRKAM